jgi:hypothetical protein
MKMENFTKGMLVLIVICITSICFLIFIVPRSSNDFTTDLKDMGINVIHINNIDGVIRTSIDKADFIQKALQTRTVYSDGLDFLVFANNSQTIAYQYNPPILG